MAERTISDCAHAPLLANCRKCGLSLHPDDPALKTTNYHSFLNCSAQKYLKHMRKRQSSKLDPREIT